jgi:hypothetical protein
MNKGCSNCNYLLKESNLCLKCILYNDRKDQISKGEWNCISCDIRIPGEQNRCLRCNLDSKGNKVKKHVLRAPDWNCPECNIQHFGKTDYCFSCNLNRIELTNCEQGQSKSDLSSALSKEEPE